MKRLLFLILLIALVTSCSRHGSTTSKIKISGAGIFSGSFGSTASNGMILYGKSSDGKNFTKILDSDTSDLEFPNGTWSFFAVAWDDSTPSGNFTGVKKCGSSEGVQLNGAETTINISLTVNGCNSFTFYHPQVTTCKSIGAVNSNTPSSCNQTNNNKGYATWMRVAIPEFKNFQGSLTLNTNALRTYCIPISNTTGEGTEESGEASTLASIFLPKDAVAFTEVFYSQSSCDGQYGVDSYMVGGPKVKVFDTAADRRFFVETNEIDVCKNERLVSNAARKFASGRGSKFHPYTICNIDQWNAIGFNFGTYFSSSFELLSDLDFKNLPMLMIGDQSAAVSNTFVGSFNGNNHKVSNGILFCPAGITQHSGVFRKVGSNVDNLISNVTFNGVVNLCTVNEYAGGIVGELINARIENANFFGAVNGLHYVGGIVGLASIDQASSQNVLTNVHVNASLDGVDYLGGIAGKVSFGSGMNGRISKTSFKGKIESQNGTLVMFSSYLGGIVGYFDGNSATSAVVEKSVVVADLLKGSQYIGGIVGKTIGGDIFDNYVRTTFETFATSAPALGGILGFASGSGVEVNRNFNFKSFLKKPAGVTTKYGGLIGDGTVNSCSNSFWTGQSTYSQASSPCHSSQLTGSAANQQASYTSFDFTNVWDMPTEGKDYPRLKWEIASEDKIPYLKRKCIGTSMFDTIPAGSGTVLDPYLICTEDQFQSISAGTVNVLKRDLNFLGANFPQRPEGKYILYAEKRNISDLFISGGSAFNEATGMFKKLSDGSFIDGLKLHGVSLGASGMTGAYSCIDVNAGIVAGVNNGIISDLDIGESAVTYETIDFNAAGFPMVIIGGAVGVNDVNGFVSGDVDIVVKVANIKMTSNLSGKLLLGGVVGQNLGKLIGSKVNGDVGYSATTGADYNSNSNVSVGNVVGVNLSVLKKLDVNNKLYVSNYSSTLNGHFGLIAGENKTLDGKIEDALVKSSISFNNFSPLNYKLVPNQVLGTTKRIIIDSDNLYDSSVFFTGADDSFCATQNPSSFPNLNCIDSDQTTYATTPSNGLLVKENGVSKYDIPNMNSSFGLVLDNKITWRLMQASSNNQFVSEPPEVIEANGSLEKIGKPFN